jgi:dolichol-phosphate mannosyltransferase
MSVMARPWLRRFVKFALVGGVGVGVNMGIFWLLTAVLRTHYLVAGPIAIEAAICSNFLLNNSWTFADRQARRLEFATFGRYQLVTLGGMLINLGMLQVVSGLLGQPPMLGNLVGIVAGTCWNFVLSSRWAWARPQRLLHVPMHATPRGVARAYD